MAECSGLHPQCCKIKSNQTKKTPTAPNQKYQAEKKGNGKISGTRSNHFPRMLKDNELEMAKKLDGQEEGNRLA